MLPFIIEPSPDVSESRTPVVVLYNSRSGSSLTYGEYFLKAARKLLHPAQVYDLDQHSPNVVIEMFKNVPNLRILVGGGDGTIAWVLHTLWLFYKDETERIPPIGMVPLGTGNDLSRTLGWGGSLDGMCLLSYLWKISQADISYVDKWKISIKSLGNDRLVSEYVMYNYMSLGCDATICGEIDDARKSHPALFFSQTATRVWYTTFGVMQLVKDNIFPEQPGDIEGLEEEEALEGEKDKEEEEEDAEIDHHLPAGLQLAINGQSCPISTDGMQGIILQNIPSYSGGVKLWNDNQNESDESGLDSDVEWERCQVSSYGQPLVSEQPQANANADENANANANTQDDTRHMEWVAPGKLSQSFQDGRLEVLGIRDILHMGLVYSNLSGPYQIGQGTTVEICIPISRQAAVVALQVDGERKDNLRQGQKLCVTCDGSICCLQAPNQVPMRDETEWRSLEEQWLSDIDIRAASENTLRMEAGEGNQEDEESSLWFPLQKAFSDTMTQVLADNDHDNAAADAADDDDESFPSSIHSHPGMEAVLNSNLM